MINFLNNDFYVSEVAVGNGVIIFMFGVLLLLRDAITWLENRKLLSKSTRAKGRVVDLVYSDGEMLACQLLVEFRAIDGKTYRVESSTGNVTWEVYNIYDGCSAAYSWEYWIQIPRPPVGYKYLFEEELVGR